MSLNCKPGDLAVVVSGVPQSNLGKVVTVTRLCRRHLAMFGMPCWLYEGDLDGPGGGRCTSIHDACLRPLRPGEGDDETLAWAGRPATHDAPVAG